MNGIVVAIALLLVATPAHATWSVVAFDRSTGQAVIASATCVTARDLAGHGGLKGIQAIVVPGMGIAVAQASLDATHRNQRFVFTELQRSTPPADIVERLQEDPQVRSRQFAILDAQGRVASFSGASTLAVSLDEQGRVPDTEIVYSILGNILASADVVHDAVRAFSRTRGSLTDRAVAALEAGDASGGDRRCSCQTPPATAAPCDTRHAFVAYLLRADRTDAIGRSHSDGAYALYLNVTDENITPSEDANPVKTLRKRYDEWSKTHR